MAFQNSLKTLSYTLVQMHCSEYVEIHLIPLPPKWRTSSFGLPLFWPVLYLKYCLLRLAFDSHTENASSSQHQVSWKQCVLHLWWNNVKFWFRMFLYTPRWQISPLMDVWQYIQKTYFIIPIDDIPLPPV